MLCCAATDKIDCQGEINPAQFWGEKKPTQREGWAKIQSSEPFKLLRKLHGFLFFLPPDINSILLEMGKN